MVGQCFRTGTSPVQMYRALSKCIQMSTIQMARDGSKQRKVGFKGSIQQKVMKFTPIAENTVGNHTKPTEQELVEIS